VASPSAYPTDDRTSESSARRGAQAMAIGPSAFAGELHMRHSIRAAISSATARLLIGSVLLIVLVSASPGISRAVQLIPSLGFTKSTDANASAGKFYGSVALRAALLPSLSAEGGIAYRDESFSNDDLKVRMWPVTASLWLTPVPMLYAGGGLGWYRTTYDYKATLPFTNTTTDKVGVHLGGGLSIPVAHSLGLDLNGRYVFMQKDNSVQFPTAFNPDFWSTSVGLAIKF
jgi:hypothetical protein